MIFFSHRHKFKALLDPTLNQVMSCIPAGSGSKRRKFKIVLSSLVFASEVSISH